MVSLKPGLVGEATLIVEEKHSAHHLRSGGVHVLATPIMIALMEEAAHNLVDPLLEPEKLSVGTNLNVKHLAATPIGMKVTARAELLSVDGRTLTFRVEAHDEREKVGEGNHTRAIISLEPFFARLQKKSNEVFDNRETVLHAK
ncbi:MAG: thioesterase family protein [Syntrophobacteraceae bacterium]